MVELRNQEIIVVDGLQKYLNCLVIRANQTAPVPDYPYISYTVITPMGSNNGTWGKYEDGKDRKPYTQTWSFTVQSDDHIESVDLAIKARDWLDHVGTVYLNDNHVIVQQVGNITNRDNLLTIEYEYRNGFDVEFWLFSEVDDTTDQIGTIDEVVIDDSSFTPDIPEAPDI